MKPYPLDSLKNVSMFWEITFCFRKWLQKQCSSLDSLKLLAVGNNPAMNIATQHLHDRMSLVTDSLPGANSGSFDKHHCPASISTIAWPYIVFYFVGILLERVQVFRSSLYFVPTHYKRSIVIAYISTVKVYVCTC